MSAIGPTQTCRKTQSMSLLGVKRTCACAPQMSAFDPQRTSVFALRMSVFGVKADMAFCGADACFDQAGIRRRLFGTGKTVDSYYRNAIKAGCYSAPKLQ